MDLSPNIRSADAMYLALLDGIIRSQVMIPFLSLVRDKIESNL